MLEHMDSQLINVESRLDSEPGAAILTPIPGGRITCPGYDEDSASPYAKTNTRPIQGS